MSNRKIDVLICDDEDDARLLIREYISDYPSLAVVKECNNGAEAVLAIDSLEPSLVFLDIQMPGLNGFQVLQHITCIPQIIFSTAFDKFALQAFDNNAVDYLLKPYAKERFAQAVNKALNNTRASFDNIRRLSDQLHANSVLFSEKIFVEAGTKMIALLVNDIVWIEADGDYTRIHVANRFYISRYGISVLEQKLNPSLFLRVHRSALVNTNMIKQVNREADGYHVVLVNDVSHKVGRTFTNTIRKLIR